MFQIIGSFILTLEAFGPIWRDNFFNKFLAFSNWARKNIVRGLIISLLMVAPFVVAAETQNKILLSVLLPIGIFVLLFSTLLDTAGSLKKLTDSMINNKKITPIGFIMLLIGYLVQFVAAIKQMN